MRIKELVLASAVSFLILSSCDQDESEAYLRVTTDSKLALEFYETGMLAFDQVKLGLAYHNLELAVKEDPDFFMAYFWMYFMSHKSPKLTADLALKVKSDLDPAEKEIRSGFKYLLDGQDEKVVEHFERAISYYPKDPNLYKILYITQFQYLKDLEGARASLEKAIDAQPDYAMAYNQLGYVLMDLGEYGQAEKAFDKYISLAPEIANPYDSKGDFFMSTGEYGKAYESYMKAYEMDDYFKVSQKKAEKAKSLAEDSEHE